MMYEPHPSFKDLPDETRIWRYMDFAKFFSMMDRQSLFFARPSSFLDPWEGYSPKNNYTEDFFRDAPKEHRKKYIEWALQTKEFVRKHLAVNCWHVNNHESEAFWRNYSGRGVAIQSTVGRLKESFHAVTDYNIYIGEIEYKDANTDYVKDGNAYNSILWKRKSFEYEREVRAVICEMEDIKGSGLKPFTSISGQNITVDLAMLIENVYTNPFEKEDSFNELVKDLIKKCGLSFNVCKSDLMDSPNI
ncbi:MAG: DUF2971 domain-containing protein [Patescibacteria group bacterium]